MSSTEQVVERHTAAPIAGSSGDAGLWDQLAGARDAQEFCQAWLGIQCGLLPGAITGLLLLDDGDGHFSSAAMWPDRRRDLAYLTDTAQHALTRRTSFINQPSPKDPSAGNLQIGQPVETAGALKGVVVVEFSRLATDTAALVRQLRWGAGWLELMFGRMRIEQDAVSLARSNFALQVLASVQQHPTFLEATQALANELASRLACSCVSIGYVRGRNIQLAAMSSSAVFSERAHIVAAIENAMEEAGDQNATVAVPATRGTQRRIALAHDDLARQTGAASVASVVISNGERRFGAILLERDRGDAFDDSALDLIEAAAALAGPGLETKSEANRLVSGRAVHAARTGLRALFGPGRPAVKLGAVAIVALLGYLSVAQGTFRIAAKAVVEGATQRASVAPFDGFVATAPIRAGDIVEAGQLLATLDDRELKLEAARWRSEKSQQQLKYSDAMSKHDRSVALVASAAMDQTEAQLSLIEDKLARAVITAPFRGVVVSGDLRQMLGSPIEKGKVMFEIAPLEAYRVVLQVDERDIGYLAEGQGGALVLTGLSSESVPISVKTITPVASASEGRNHFRVEASAQGQGSQLRPGMEGIGKIDVDRRSLVMIWTRSLADWIRITVWKWTP